MENIEQTISDILSLTKAMKSMTTVDGKEKDVPFLLVSNPGYGKTTDIRKWCEKNGYHLEVLIGSRSTPEEIMGYQVNEPGAKSLVHKNPVWYDRIMEASAKGQPSVLFEDEISTCPDATQGSLLSLNQDREIGNGQKLPKDTIVIAAANYYANLPASMNIITPQLNRFCIVNLLDNSTNLDLLNEFLRPSKGTAERHLVELSQESKQEIADEFYNLMVNLFTAYSDKDSSNGYLDLHNTDIGSIYTDAENQILNVLTGRGMSNLGYLVQAMVALQINSDEMVSLIIDGLGGMGTNNFQDDLQRDKYRKIFKTSLKALLDKEIHGTVQTDRGNKANLLNVNNTIAEAIQEFIMNKEAIYDLTSNPTDDFKTLYTKILDRYGDVIKVAKEMARCDQVKAAQYISDMDGIQELIKVLKELDGGINKIILEELKRISMDNMTIYAGLTGVSDDLTNYKDLYEESTPKLISKIVVIELKDSPRVKKGLVKAGVRIAGQHNMFFPMGIQTKASEVSIARSYNKEDIERVLTYSVAA